MEHKLHIKLAALCAVFVAVAAQAADKKPNILVRQSQGLSNIKSKALLEFTIVREPGNDR